MNTEVPEFAQCATAGVVDSYAGLAVSPDGRQGYGSDPGSIAAFARDRRTGLLAQPPAPGVCIDAEADAAAVTSVRASARSTLAISPDGKNVYTRS